MRVRTLFTCAVSLLLPRLVLLPALPYRRSATDPMKGHRPALAGLLLLTAFTLLAPTARAGTYVWSQTVNGVTTTSPTYADGAQSGNGYLSGPYTAPGGGGTYGGGNFSTVSSTGVTSASATSQGTVTLTYTWQPASGQNAQTDPPPPAAVVAVTCTAAWNGLVGGPHGPVPGGVSGGCSGPPGATLTSSVPQASPEAGVTNTYVQYVIKSNPGASFSVPVSGLSASATASAPAGSGEGGECACSASVSAILYPLTISLTGTLKDSSGQDNILIGQYCTATVNVPSSPTLTFGFPNWTISGSTFTSFISSDQDTGQATPYPDPASSHLPASPHFYWKEGGTYGTLQTLQVTMPVQWNVPPSNVVHFLGNISAVKYVAVWDPYDADSEISLGTSALENAGAGFGDVTSSFAPIDGSGIGFSMLGAVGTPDLFLSQGAGGWAWLQLCKLDGIQGSGVTPMSDYRLDSAFPYNLNTGMGDVPGQVWAADSTASRPDPHPFGDTPQEGYSPLDTALIFNDL